MQLQAQAFNNLVIFKPFYQLKFLYFIKNIFDAGLSSTAFTLRGEMAYEANRAYYENQGLISSYVHRDMAYEPHRANYGGNSLKTRNFTSGEASIQPGMIFSHFISKLDI